MMQNPIWSFFFLIKRESKGLFELLRSLSVFYGLTPWELVQVERVLHERRYGINESVFNEAELGACMYIVLEGEVGIFKTVGEWDVELARVEARSFFGEMALLDEAPRSAQARSLSATSLLALSKPDLEMLVDRHPRLGSKILRNLGQLLSVRLRQANENLENLERKLAECRSQREAS